MNEETGPGHETYLRGGNLLNEQDRIAREKKHHVGGEPHAADPGEESFGPDDGGAPDSATHRSESGDADVGRGPSRAKGDGKEGDRRTSDPKGESGPKGEPSGPKDADDDIEQPVPGAAIPEHHADSITEYRHTHGGGAVPPGSAEAGHTVRRRW